MKHIIFAALLLTSIVVTAERARSTETAMVFPMSSVESVDVRNQLLTFKSNDGRLWLLRVADPMAIRREALVKGDLVRIEVGLDDQIVRLEKVRAQ